MLSIKGMGRNATAGTARNTARTLAHGSVPSKAYTMAPKNRNRNRTTTPSIEAETQGPVLPTPMEGLASMLDGIEAQAPSIEDEAEAPTVAQDDPATVAQGSIDRTVATVATTVGRGRRIESYNLAPYQARGSKGGVHYKRNTSTPLTAKGGSWVATLAILASTPGGCPLSILDAVPCGDSTRGILAWLAAGMGWGIGTYANGCVYLHDGRGIDGTGQGLTTGRPVAHPGTLASGQVASWCAGKVDPATVADFLARMAGEASQVG